MLTNSQAHQLHSSSDNGSTSHDQCLQCLPHNGCPLPRRRLSRPSSPAPRLDWHSHCTSPPHTRHPRTPCTLSAHRNNCKILTDNCAAEPHRYVSHHPPEDQYSQGDVYVRQCLLHCQLLQYGDSAGTHAPAYPRLPPGPLDSLWSAGMGRGVACRGSG